jgi:hypothetical protein
VETAASAARRHKQQARRDGGWRATNLSLMTTDTRARMGSAPPRTLEHATSNPPSCILHIGTHRTNMNKPVYVLHYKKGLYGFCRPAPCAPLLVGREESLVSYPNVALRRHYSETYANPAPASATAPDRAGTTKARADDRRPPAPAPLVLPLPLPLPLPPPPPPPPSQSTSHVKLNPSSANRASR